MLASLNYSVEFPTTGRTFKNRIVFAPGLTAITGRNEAGKSLVLEFIRYALFGKAALRGLAADYRNLSVDLELAVRGETWQIARRHGSEHFSIGGVVVAVGADAINKEVPKRLGFGLDVFDIACCANQDELLALTQMKPTARRAMVDSLIGIDLLEDIEKLCKNEAKNQQTISTTLMLSMPVPQEPEKPLGYVNSDRLRKTIEIMEQSQREREQLLLVQEPVQPEKPEDPNLPYSLARYEEEQHQRNRTLQERARVEGQLMMIPEPTISLAELEKAERYHFYLSELERRGPKPDYTYDQLFEWKVLLEDKEMLEDVIECPKCQHEFVRDWSSVDVEQVRAQPDPPLGTLEILDQMKRCANWKEPLEPVDEVDYDDIDLYRERKAHDRAGERAGIAKRLAALRPSPDRSREIEALREFERAMAVYDERRSRYADELSAYESARERLSTLADRSDEIHNLRRRLADVERYERDHDLYLAAAERYADLVARATEASALGGGYTAGAAALKAARARVKAELAPSLSKAASTLIRGMTNGERQSIEVDGDFNIIVDGQPVATLSGSGKAVVNLALRIGLGRVLTSGVLPIFLGDEIDYAMDSDRVNATQETMQGLKNHLGQVVLVTHKQIEADTIVTL